MVYFFVTRQKGCENKDKTKAYKCPFYIWVLQKCKLLKEENESTTGMAAQCMAQIIELEKAMRSMVLFLIFILLFLFY